MKEKMVEWFQQKHKKNWFMILPLMRKLCIQKMLINIGMFWILAQTESPQVYVFHKCKLYKVNKLNSEIQEPISHKFQ